MTDISRLYIAVAETSARVPLLGTGRSQPHRPALPTANTPAEVSAKEIFGNMLETHPEQLAFPGA